MNTEDNQMEFEENLSKDKEIFIVKQVAEHYSSRSSTIYACFLELSKPVDCVHGDKVWEKNALS